MENSILATLPTEIQFEVLDRLSVKDLLSCSLVCREIAVLADELIIKKSYFKMRSIYTDPNVLSSLKRSYRSVWLTDQHFIYEGNKLSSLLSVFMQGIKLREIRLEMLEEDGPERITEFFDFLIKNPNVQTISLSSFYEITLNEFIGKIKSILPHVNVHILRAFEDDKNAGFIVPEKLKSLEVYSEMTEMQLLRTLKSYPKLKTLRYCLKSHKNPKEVIQEILRLNINEVSVETLLLNDIENLDEMTPSLSVFKHLKSLTVHFREEGIDAWEANEHVQQYSDKFKFIQGLYANNFQTLRNLQLEISNSPHIYNLLPSKDINLTLEEMTFDLSFSDNAHEDALKFVKLFVNQQIQNLRKLYFENMEIDDEMINLLSEAEHLEKLSLITCNIQFETVWPPFSNLKTLDLTDSTITYSSLQSFLGNYRVQNTLESLSLERIHPKKGRKKQLKVTCPYNFQKLKKLNLLFCNMKIDFLNKFYAPELEQLNYDYHDLELPLNNVMEFIQLKVLCLGYHTNFDEISNILTNRNNLEIFEIMVSSSSLTTALKYLLIYGGKIKLAKIVCTDLAEVIDSLENSFKESVHNYPGYDFEFYKEREKFMKFSNTSTTIIVHTYNQAYREHSQFYENFLISLWE